MSISVRHILQLMEKHVTELKQLPEGSPKIKEHAASIKALTDVLLLSDSGSAGEMQLPQASISAPPSFTQAPKSSPVQKPAVPYAEEDGNGDSIFDF
ncbi:hypothetical protein A374_19250 [Fictibacillus macauensis ZFHKF-1]|uniref:YwdI family protein n=1 Tax=Fictibacillus macauensis ZFHKF-1 TaxID=1196324 RepID=I8UA71_9BACL|nr:YwdI family protein [Fictibacillus macauensis]EIT83688.1 hypothetical protein A374_19250 [Fictibacillus macauensis ZFHKF-1]